MKSYLVLGSGVGKAIALNLAHQKDTERVAIMDKDKSVLKLGRILNDKCEYIVSDLTKLNVPSLFKQFGVVISALPAKYNFELAKKAIEQGVNFCDLGGVVDITWRQINKLNKLAKENKVSVIPDCGLMPGMGVLFAKKLLLELRNVDTITIYVGGMPQKPLAPVYYQRVFNYDGLASICYDKSPVLLSKRIFEVDPMSQREEFTIPELVKFSKKFSGRVEAFITAGASIAPWTFKDMGVSNFYEKTVRWPGFVDFVKSIPRSKFKNRLEPYINTPVTKENPDLVWMKVQATREWFKSDISVRSYSILDLFDARTGLTAMERTTGFPTAIIARMIANKQSAVGVNTPETAFNYEQMNLVWLELLKHFDIKSP